MKHSTYVKQIVPVLLVLCSLFSAHAQDIDVLHYTISLDEINYNTKYIHGFTDVHFKALSDKPVLELELLLLNVERTSYLGKKIKNSYKNNIIRIQMDKMQMNDTATVRVYYAGTPQAPSYFGGFYFKENIAYNLAVLIDKKPHNFGKCWFPCVDNFSDKATYSFYIKVSNDLLMAVCNGSLEDINRHDDGSITYYWQLHKPIATYLVSIAVGEYEEYETKIKGMNGSIPMSVYTHPDSLDNVKASFARIGQAIVGMEKLFGPYVWERIGYVNVPMEGGAMEHATNVAIPMNFSDGTLAHEHTLIHELAHSWFGNLVTCASNEDMWLNEGFATYCESLMIEELDGKEAAAHYRRRLHLGVLNASHKAQGKVYAVAGSDGKPTYGMTVYQKGAMMLHSLRGYLGDEVFFSAMRQYLKEYAYSTATTSQLLASLSKSTGQDLSDFFATQINEKGFIHIGLDSVNVLKLDSLHYQVGLYLRQSLLYKKKLSRDNYVEIVYIDTTGGIHEMVERYYYTGLARKLTAVVPFAPAAVLIDPDEKLADAAVRLCRTIDEPDSYSYLNTNFKLHARNIQDKSLIQVSYSAIPACKAYQQGGRRYVPAAFYWTIAGAVHSYFDADGYFTNSCKPAFQPTDGLDIFSDKNKNKRFGMYYRPDRATQWKLVQTMSLSDLDTELRVQNIKLGEYAMMYSYDVN